MVDCALTAPGCYGARMTGAGYGGSAVALVETKHTEKFVKKVFNSYQALTGKKAHLYVCKAAEGTSVFSNNEFAAQ